MDSLYSVVVRLGMDSTGFGAGATLATGVLQKLEQQALAAGASTASLGKSLAMIGGGIAMIGGGLAGVNVLGSWAKDAGVMQDALVQVGIAAGGTRAQLAALYSQSFAVANVTQYSGAQVLAMEQLMARQGFRDLTGHQTQRQVIGEAIPQFAQSSEIIQHFNKVGYEQTVTAFTSLSHMFGAFSGPALAANVAHATGAAIVSHLSPSQLVNTIRYLTPALKSGQLSNVDAISLAALGNETGLTMGKGGSNIGALLRSLAPTGAAKHDHALAEIEKLAGGDFWQHGRALPLPQVLGLLNRFYDSAKGPHAQISPEMAGYLAKNAFLVQGSQAAAVLANDASIKQFGAIRAQILTWTPAKEKQVQGELNMTLPGQMATLSGNLGSIRSLLGAQLLPAIGPILHGFVDVTSSVVNLLRLHPGIAQFAVTFVAVSTAAALIAGPVLIAAGAFGILSAAGVVTAGAFLPFTATVFGVIAAVSLVSLAVTHWSTVMGALTGKLGLAWQVLSVGAVAIGGFVAGMRLAALATAAWNGLAVIATVVTQTWTIAQAAGSAVATLAAGAYGLLAAAVMAMSGGFGIATIAAGALDIALSPITLIVAGVTAGALAAYYAWTHWGEVFNAFTGELGPVWQGVASLVSVLDPALPLIAALSGAFHNWGGIMAAIGGIIRTITTDFAKLIGLLPTLPALLEKSALHLLPGGDQLAQMLGLGGPAKGGGGGGPAGTTATTGVPVHAAAAIHHATHLTHSAVVHHHVAPHSGQSGAGSGGSRGGGGGQTTTTVNLHVHPGAVVTNVHPAPGHDSRKIADVITTTGAAALAKEFAAQLARSGIAPATIRPSLHHLGTS